MRKSIVILSVLALILMAGIPAAQAGSDAQDILKEGILGAAVGGLSAGTTHGKAGKGALIGAGTMVAGSALMNAMTSDKPHQEKQQALDVHQEGYTEGFSDGYKKGYHDGWNAANSQE